MAKTRAAAHKHVSARSARKAVREVRKAQRKHKTHRATSRAWKKGGREWSKVFGHFGAVA